MRKNNKDIEKEVEGPLAKLRELYSVKNLMRPALQYAKSQGITLSDAEIHMIQSVAAAESAVSLGALALDERRTELMLTCISLISDKVVEADEVLNSGQICEAPQYIQ